MLVGNGEPVAGASQRVSMSDRVQGLLWRFGVHARVQGALDPFGHNQMRFQAVDVVLSFAGRRLRNAELAAAMTRWIELWRQRRFNKHLRDRGRTRAVIRAVEAVMSTWTHEAATRRRLINLISALSLRRPMQYTGVTRHWVRWLACWHEQRRRLVRLKQMPRLKALKRTSLVVIEEVPVARRHLVRPEEAPRRSSPASPASPALPRPSSLFSLTGLRRASKLVNTEEVPRQSPEVQVVPRGWEPLSPLVVRHRLVRREEASRPSPRSTPRPTTDPNSSSNSTNDALRALATWEGLRRLRRGFRAFQTSARAHARRATARAFCFEGRPHARSRAATAFATASLVTSHATRLQLLRGWRAIKTLWQHGTEHSPSLTSCPEHCGEHVRASGTEHSPSHAPALESVTNGTKGSSHSEKAPRNAITQPKAPPGLHSTCTETGAETGTQLRLPRRRVDFGSNDAATLAVATVGSMIGGGDPATLAVSTVGSMIGSGDPATFAIATVGSTVGLSPAFDYLPPAASGAEEAAGAGSLEEAAGEGSLPHGLSELRAKLRRQLQEKIEASTSPVLDVESHYSQRFQSRLQWLEQAEVAVGRLVLEIEPMPSLPIPIALDPPSEATATIIGGVKLRRTASFLRRVSLSTLSHAPSLGFWAAPASLVAAPASLTAAPAAASVKEADFEEASVHAASSKGGSAAGNGSGAGGATGSSLQLDLFVLRSKLQRELREKAEALTNPILHVESSYSQTFHRQLQWLEQADELLQMLAADEPDEHAQPTDVKQSHTSLFRRRPSFTRTKRASTQEKSPPSESATVPAPPPPAKHAALERARSWRLAVARRASFDQSRAKFEPNPRGESPISTPRVSALPPPQRTAQPTEAEDLDTPEDRFWSI